MTGADFGVYGTYMTDIVPFNVKAGASAIKNSILALSEQKAKQIAIDLAPDIIHSTNVGGLTYSTPEFFEFVTGKSTVAHNMRKGLAPFMRNMSFALDTAKVLNWKSLYHPGMNATEALELGRVIEQLTNTLSPARMGMSAMRKQIESSFFFYAMQYTRSGLATVGDLFAFNKSSLYAAKKLAGLLVTGASTIYLASYLLKADEYNFLNPSKPLLSFKKNGYWYGLGGAVIPIIDALGDCINSVVEGKPEKVASRIGRYFQGRSSLLTGFIMELAKGKNFIGNPIYGQTTLETAKLMALNSVVQRVTPLWTRNAWDMLEGKSISEVAPSLFAEAIGFKTRDITQFEKYTNTLDYYAQNTYQRNWEDLHIQEKRQLQDKEPAVLQAHQEYQAAQAAKKTYGGTDAQYNEGIDYGVAYNAINAKHRNAHWENELARKNGLPYYKWLQAGKDIDKARSEAIDALNTKYPNVVKTFSKNVDKTNMLAGDIAYYDYINKIYDGRFDLPGGEFNWNAKEKFDKEWIGEWGRDKFDSVRLCMRTGKNLPNLWVQRSTDMDEIGKSGYWELPKNIDENSGLNLARIKFRQNNPNIDALLYIWHYTDNLQTQNASDIAQAKMNTYDITDRGVPDGVDSIKYESQWQLLQQNYDMAYHNSKGYPQSNEVRQMFLAVRNIMARARADEYVAKRIDLNDDYINSVSAQAMKLQQLKQMAMIYKQTHPEDIWADTLLARISVSEHEMYGRISRLGKYK